MSSSPFFWRLGTTVPSAGRPTTSTGLPLYRYIGGVGACTLPIPIVGIGTGGRYRDPGRSRWFKPSYEFAAYGAGSYAEAIHWSWRCAEGGQASASRTLP